MIVLDTLDLKLKADKNDFAKMRDERMEKLGVSQRRMKDAQIPVIILAEGWNYSGKGEIINCLVQAMDPRGVKVYMCYFPNEVERSKPFFWQFWNKLPQKGGISIFDHSWYYQTITKQLNKELRSEDDDAVYSDINSFERLLADDNHVIIKLFTHISAKEQEKRIKKLKKEFNIDFRGIKNDLEENDVNKKTLQLYEEMFRKSDTAYAQWLAIESNDLNYAIIKTLDYIISMFEKKLVEIELKKDIDIKIKEKANELGQSFEQNPFHSSVLNKVDLTKSVSKKEYNDLVKNYQERLRYLQFQLFKNKIPMILAFEGWDAAGKGGTIKRLTSTLDPRAYYVVPTAAPGFVDKKYNYLWRFWEQMPSKGMIAIFDRTWYGRVMVERVEGFARDIEWSRAYREINDMENQLINNGNILLKFWLQIDKDEQLNRFKAREEDPLKRWKITDEDWRNREKWDEYEKAVNEMLFRTSTTKASWTIVESNCKRYGRLKTMKTVIDAIEERLK